MPPRSRRRGTALVTLLSLLSVISCSQSVDPVAAQPPAQRSAEYSIQPPQIIVSDEIVERASKRPNVVVLMTDDQRLSDMEYMPRTRRLIGRAGITFTEALSPNPLCCPARASFLTGQASHNNGVLTNKTEYGGYQRLKTEETLPVWLQRAGYNTAISGKHLNGYQYAKHGSDPGWTRFNVLDKGIYRYTEWGAIEKGRLKKRTGYVTDYIGERVVSFINQFRRQRNPFFIWATHVGPHVAKIRNGWAPPPAAPRHQGKYTYRDFPLDTLRKPSFKEDLSDKSRTFRSVAGRVTKRKLKANHLARVLALKAVDEANAKVIRALKDTGELENTVVIFTSDNGYLMGEHSYVGKTLGFEEALRVPLMVRGPGIKAGSRATQAVTTMDLTATIADLAGASPTLLEDGRSLRRIFERPGSATVADTVGIESGAYNSQQAEDSPWMYQGVRTNRYTYLGYATGDVELYDRRRDPFQLTNVAGRTAYEKTEAELARRLAALRGCAGAECRTSFGPVPKPFA